MLLAPLSSSDSEIDYNDLKPKKLTETASDSKGSYHSRRSKNYDDNESDDGQVGYLDSQAPNGVDIKYVNTLG